MKYLKLFEEESLYNNDIGNDPSPLLPNVSLITDGDNNIIKFNINPIRMATYEPYNNNIQLFKSWDNIKKAYVNDIDLDEVLNIREYSLVITPNDIFYNENIGVSMVNVTATDTFANLKSYSLEIEGELLDSDNVFITIYSPYGAHMAVNQGTISELVERKLAWLNEDRTILNLNTGMFYSSILIDFCGAIARDGVFLETTNHITGTKLSTKKEYVVNNDTLPNITFEGEEMTYIAIEAKTPSEITENTLIILFQNNETYQVIGTLGEVSNTYFYNNGILFIPVGNYLQGLLCFTNSDMTDICDSTNYILTIEDYNIYIGAQGIIIESEHNANVLFETNNRFKSIQFGTSVKSLNRHALHYVTSIDDQAFYGCSGLTGELIIPDSVNSIGSGAFYECSGLTSVVIPDSVTSIGTEAFSRCSGLTGELVIPDSVTSIGNNAFEYCSGLTSVEIGSGVTSIGGSAFSGCSGLTGELVIPDSVTSIGGYAFYQCTGLTSVEFGNGVNSIGTSAFHNCSGLTSVVIPDSVTSIDGSAFKYCSGLTSVEIGSGVNSIGSSAFYDCPGLKSVVIPDSVTSIGESAFSYCSGLTSVEIGNGVTNIGNYAFRYCSGLTSVEIGNSCTRIGNYAFESCSQINTITCQAATPPSIGSSTFKSIKSGGTLYVPAGSDYRGWMSTGNYYLGKYGWFIREIGVELPEFELDGYDVAMLVQPLTNSSATKICNKTTSIAEIKVNDTVLDTVSTGYTFSEVGKWNVVRIKYTDGVTSIPSSSFSSCTRMYEVKIADSMTSIGESAFESCLGLTSIVIPDSVTSIGPFAFQSCSGLASLEIGGGVTNIDSHAFAGCLGLTGELVIPDSVQSISDSAFQYCSGLTSVEIGSGCTRIGNYAFINCFGLIEITCHAVTAPSIQSGTFSNMKSGGTLYVPAGSDYSSWISNLSTWTIQYI